MRTAIIFDTETTGLPLPGKASLDKQPKIIELGALLVGKDGPLGELSQLIDPRQPLDAKITEITGIKGEDLVGMPTFIEFLPKLIEFFTPQADYLIAHNANFDVSLLTFDLQRADAKEFPWPKETICTVQEFTPEFGRRPRLIELYEVKLGKPLAQTHRALDDCKALYELLVADKYMDAILTDLERINNNDPAENKD